MAAGLVAAGDEWFIAKRSSDRVTATVTVDGTLRVGAKEYASPSMAARAVLGVSTNGWKRWKYRDNNGKERHADALRSQL